MDIGEEAVAPEILHTLPGHEACKLLVAFAEVQQLYTVLADGILRDGSGDSFKHMLHFFFIVEQLALDGVLCKLICYEAGEQRKATLLQAYGLQELLPLLLTLQSPDLRLDLATDDDDLGSLLSGDPLDRKSTRLNSSHL